MIGSAVLGVIDGLAIGLLAVGLVLVYRANRFVNFAHAQLGIVPALLLAKLVNDAGVPWFVAFPVCLGTGAAIGGLAEFTVIRRLSGRSRLALLVATVGLAQLLLAPAYIRAIGPDRVRLNMVGYPLPFHPHFSVAGAPITGDRVLTLLVVPAAALLLVLVLARTTFGKSVRAAASNREAAILAGLPTARLSTSVWAIAGALSALSAILAAPGQAVFGAPALGPSLLLRALAAASIGGMTSVGGALAGGAGLGVLEAVVVHLTHHAGAGDLAVFALIMVGLFVHPTALMAPEHDAEVPPRPAAPPRDVSDRVLFKHHQTIGLMVGLLLVLAAPHLGVFHSEGRQFILALVPVFALVGVSVVVLTGWSGQVSLGQFAFLMAGAFLGGRLMVNGWPLPSAMLVCAAVGATLALLIGAPAFRTSGLALAVTTLAFAVVAPAWLFREPWFARPGALTVPAPYVRGLGHLATQRSVYYLAFGCLAAVLGAAALLRRSPAGRMIIAARTNPKSLTTLGIPVWAIRASVFAWSGALTGLAGVLWIAANRNVSVELAAPEISLVVLSIAIIGGLTSLWGTIAGAVVVIGIPAMLAELAPSLTASTPWIRLLLSGGGLLATQLAYPQGIAGMVASAWAALGRRVRRELGRRPLPAVPTVALDASAVTVRFGGLTAVNALDLTVRPGEIVGLIGANGAGKTTLLNAVSGLVPVTSGSITVFGTEVTHLGPEYRAHHGVARSFQDARLFPGLTVREAIQLALAARTRSGVAAAALSAPWVRRVDRTTLRRASDIATAFGLEQWLDTPTDELSTGTRRVCDLAIQYATKPRLLLLDEPTAGVAQRDAEAFGPLIRKMASELGCAVVLIEHDVPMIMRTADRVYCLESGAVIASGSPAEVRTDRRVIESYLGQSAAAIERSGAAKPARARAQRTKGNVRVVPQHNGTARPHRNGSARRHLVGTKE